MNMVGTPYSDVHRSAWTAASVRAGPNLVDHGPVVAGLEALGADQEPHPRLAQDIAKLVAAVRRVDGDQDEAGLGRGVLKQHPFGAVGRPDPDPVADRQSGGDQAAGERVGVRVERRIGPPAAGRDVHEHLGVRVPGAATRRRLAPIVSPSSGVAEVP